MKNKLIRLDSLYEAARQVIITARAKAYAAINTEMVSAYWEVGMLIVEEEQNGRERGGYGKALIAGLSERLTAEFGGGYSEGNLKYFRQFYLTYPIGDALRRELTNIIAYILNNPVKAGWVAHWEDWEISWRKGLPPRL